MAFLVISLSPWSPHCPHIVPVSSLSSTHCPHSPQKVPMWSPWLWSPLSLWSPPHVVPVVPMLSPLSPRHPRHPRHPHVIPMSPCHPNIIPIAPRRSPCDPHACGLRGLCCLCGLHPMLSTWSPHCPRHPHIVPTSSLSFPHCLEGSYIIPNPQIPTSPTPISQGGWGTPNQ